MATSAPRQRIAGTQTQTQTQTQPVPLQPTLRQPVLHLRGARTEPRVQWAEDVVDNEGLGRKSSKVCCIYHAPKASIDESSEESSSGSDSDSSGDDGGARPAGGKKAPGRGRGDGHGHEHGDDCTGHAHEKGKKAKMQRKRSPNAYEKMPRAKDGASGNRKQKA